MNGIVILSSILINFISLLMLPAHANEPYELDQEHTILILKSKESAYYNQTIHTIKNTLSKESTISIGNIHQNPPLNNSTLIITLGIPAAHYARKEFPNIKKIITFLNLKQSSELLINNNEIHLLIELPTATYIKFSHTLFPKKRLGVLYQKTITNLTELQNNNLFLVEVIRKNEVISATRDIIKSADVLMALPNKEIFNRHSLKGILLSTYQNDTPLISYSPAHVKAGAVAAIYASPNNLGEHIIDIVQTVLASKQHISKRYFAKYYSIKVNQRVAQSLSLSIKKANVIAQNLSEKK